MRTINVNLYKFEELSKLAQTKAIEDNRNINVDYEEWYDGVYESFKDQHKEFDIEKIYFSGFWSQGDGAMFEYDGISDELFHKAIDSLDVAGWKKQFIKNNCCITAKGKHSGRYYHEKCCTHTIELDTFGSKYPNIESFIYESEEKIADFIISEYETLARDLYKQLSDDYDGQTSDEAVKETLIANDWEYLETGENA